MKFQILDKIDAKKTKRILIIIALFSFFYPAISGNLWFLIPCIISTVFYFYIDQQQDKQSQGEINNEWKRIEFDQIPAMVRKVFLGNIILN